jgi:hypothetical protein
MCIFNDQSAAYIHSATGSCSSIDLAIGDPALHLNYNSTLNRISCGSDDFSVILKAVCPSPTFNVQRWKFRLADMDHFNEMCVKELRYECFTAVSDPMEFFTVKLIDYTNLTGSF